MIGVLGGSGVYELDGLEDARWEPVGVAVRRAVGRDPARALRRRRVRVPAAPRARSPDPAERDRLPRQHRRAQARRRHRPDLGLRVRIAARGARAGHVRARRSVRRPHVRAREELLRHGLRRARLDGRPGLRAAPRRARGGRPRGGDPAPPRRRLPRDGGAAVLEPGRVGALPLVGLRRDRHDQHAGGEARARGGDLLCERRDGDGLRLLAPARGGRVGLGHRRGARRQRRARAPARGRARQGARAPPDAVPVRLRPRARHRDHHAARRARPEDRWRGSTRSRAACSRRDRHDERADQVAHPHDPRPPEARDPVPRHHHAAPGPGRAPPLGAAARERFQRRRRR